ncbi:MAG: hypothetical protein QOK19_959 [Solirubrobacteraceae bacterium]|nr:hypothetical protein [Solirubrobacteraceae bacterium]
MTTATPPARSALIVFLPAGETQLARAGLSVGVMSATQGGYHRAQLLLDITQGARVAASAYPHPSPPALALRPLAGGGGSIAGWGSARRRAGRAPQLLTPGLLAERVPGGAAYAGTDAAAGLDAVAAAGTDGHVASVSLGSTGTLPARIAALLKRSRLVVADLPGGAAGEAMLGRLAAARAPGELLIAVQRRGEGTQGELLWSGAAGLRGAPGRELTSRTTQQRGLLAAVDLAPTILEWLGAPVPAEVRGRKIETGGALHGGALRSLMARLRVVGARRLPALGFLLCAWLILLLAAARWPPARARAIRAGAVGVLWAPVAAMIPAAIAPDAPVEYATIALACFALGALSDALLPWPRAMIAPALAVPLAIVADALAHTQLLMRSVLGPNPALGARFYGIGNELKSGLAVLVLAGVAGALYRSRREPRAVAAIVGAGLVLAVIEGSARLGAGVGGVILVCAGTAVAAVMLTPGALTRRRALIAIVSPLAGLIVLALIDLATAHGTGHFSGSVLHARSAGDLRDILVRRYKAAWGELRNHAMPVATALALLASFAAVRRHARLTSPVDGDPAWLAALAGGLAAGVVGALVEDSGPVLLVVAVFALGCVLSYLWAPPPRNPGTLASR